MISVTSFLPDDVYWHQNSAMHLVVGVPKQNESGTFEVPRTEDTGLQLTVPHRDTDHPSLHLNSLPVRRREVEGLHRKVVDECATQRPTRNPFPEVARWCVVRANNPSAP